MPNISDDKKRELMDHFRTMFPPETTNPELYDMYWAELNKEEEREDVNFFFKFMVTVRDFCNETEEMFKEGKDISERRHILTGILLGIRTIPQVKKPIPFIARITERNGK